MFASALMIALPGVTAILIVNLSFGIMTRAAPQLNIFSLGFPLALMFGLVIICISLTGLLPQFQQISAEGFQLMRELSVMR